MPKTPQLALQGRLSAHDSTTMAFTQRGHRVFFSAVGC